MEEKLSHNDYVKMTIETGIPPLELNFTPIAFPESGFPFAYRTDTTIHSVLLGDLPEKSYTYVSDVKELNARLLQHNLQHAIAALQRFDKKERNVQFLSVHCPSEIVESVELYKVVSEVLQKNPNVKPDRLCLEFPATLFQKDTEKARTAILDMKLLHVKTSLLGVGTEEFPIAKILSVPPDFAILDPTATVWAGSRNKPQLLPALIAYVKSMGVETIAEGTEEERKLTRGSDCFGFIQTDTPPLSLDDALAQKEDES